jgi:hypothetical protein
VHVDKLRLARRLPLSAAVLEVADELLLGVDGQHRHPALDAGFGLRVDVLELRVAVGMLRIHRPTCSAPAGCSRGPSAA